jgi:hypothetical protein
MMLRQLAAAQPIALFREHDDRASFGRLVGQRRQLRGVGDLLFGDARQRQELGRLAVAQRDRSGLIEQERVHVAGRFDGASRHRQHVALNEPIHPRNANRGQQSADRRRNQAHQQRHQHEHRLWRS